MKVDDFSQLPGADLLEGGLKDLAAGTQSTSAFLVAIGAPRLRRLGVTLPPPEQMPSRPEHGLYRLLAQQLSRGAHSRYNALIRRLVSFERALEFQRCRERRRLTNPSNDTAG
ncbi:MAG TPA: hypothetical protein VN918_06925 [Myxococcaceae bacterium]|nr:hypothetical protein [Myxococcaceae bacterium]